MTDRELLELAAKAAGIDAKWEDEEAADFDAEYLGMRVADRVHLNEYWNPLTDDGDALRLAVKLKIDTMHTNVHAPQVHAMTDYEVACIEDSNGDPYAATRRAIVRAAAEIGKGMK